jgi:hypothetical protein
MATINVTPGYGWSSGEIVTPAKMNLAASPTAALAPNTIVNADISNSADIAGSKLADGAINNAKVANNAAIAGTKIVPRFGAQNVVINSDAAFADSNSTPILQLHSVTNLKDSEIGLFSFSNDVNGGVVTFAKSRAGADNSHALAASNDGLGALFFEGSDGSVFRRAAQMFVAIDGTPSSTSMPGRITFSTTPSESVTPAERMRIAANGNIGIANTSPSERLHVTGNIKASGFIDADTSFRGQANDSASAPSYAWTGDTNSGMFRPAANVVAFTTNGAERARITSSGVMLFGKTVDDTTSNGCVVAGNGYIYATRENDPVMVLRRKGSNGLLAMFRRDAGDVGSISVTTTATTYATSSDYRLKQNVEPMVGGLAKLAQLKPSTFEFKIEPNVRVEGFLAHEVQAVVPQAVTGEKDGEEMQGLDMSKLVPVLVAAVQELSAKVAALEAA